jgi:hypothetical protein
VLYPKLLGHAELQAALQKTPGNKNLERVWASLGKRNEKLNEPRIQREGIAFLPPSHLLPLARYLELGVRGFSDEERLTKTQRREFALQIDSLTAELGEMLKRFDACSPRGPWAFAMDEACSAAIETLWEIELSAAPEDLRGTKDSRGTYIKGWCNGVGRVFDNIPPVLSAIRNATDEWSRQRPIVGRPNASNADLTFFLRTLTKHFVRHYGQPLYAQNIALARVFFPGDWDFDPAHLKKITTHERGEK